MASPFVNQAVRMRVSPANGPGGMYATGEGLEAEVDTAPMSPPFFDRQNWRLEAGGPVQDKVRVVFVDNAKHIPWAWGHVAEGPNPEVPLVLTSEEERQVVWILQPANNGVDDAYTLQADLGIVGAAWYAGTIHGRKVVFVPLPLDAPADVKPYWVLSRAN